MRRLFLLASILVGCGSESTDEGTRGNDSDAATDSRDGSSADTSTPIGTDAADTSVPAETGYACPTAAFAGPYQRVPTSGAPSDRPAATHPDLNVKIRGFSKTGGTLGLVDVGGPTDDKAPRLYSLIMSAGTPTIVANFQVNDWDWTKMKANGPIADPAVTLTAYGVEPGHDLKLPRSGYQIAPGLSARVLFLDDDSITLKFTAEDNVVSGYTIHLLDLCVDPALRADYDDAVAKGRTSLPALASGQLFARARGTSVRVTIRDTGSFMDPRVKKDWYQP